MTRESALNELILTWHRCIQVHVAAFSNQHATAVTGALTKETEKQSAGVTSNCKAAPETIGVC